ncbi:hypothetical protein CVT24_008171 [Panaeolus cyanescens]|uniref:Histone-lysine N-methyltransferase SET5 n=1 Tax=Panaeolus cyanescens TaxID=181874 RepID=A0A409VFJ6_9AGAR|nr:hypothetical protein CVT24_008171 [Panaeolus cyanescens]
MSTSPSEETLAKALIALKAEHPALGISKVHALLLQTYPDWIVSEKRTKKILQNHGLVVQAPVQAREDEIPTTNGNNNGEASGSGSGTPSGEKEKMVYPTSRVVNNLDVDHWSKKVAVKFFDKKKGKGLVATQDIEEGEVVWKEEPFILAPEWELYDMQMKSTACSHCSTPLTPGSPLIIPCAHSPCPARFCNRLCSARSGKTHPLLCPVQNPASVPLLKYARQIEWMALHALAQVTSRIMLVNELPDDKALKADWEVVRGFAEMGMEERFKWCFRSATSPEPDRKTWKTAYAYYIQAFKEPKTPQDEKKLKKILKKPLPSHIDHLLFSYEQGFLKGLGKMSLNLESHGGLYTLHSHLNHACTPNLSIRHLDTRNALSRITARAISPIKAGEELVITYVDPNSGLKGRREALRAWGFGICGCARCESESRLEEAARARRRKDGEDVDGANETGNGDKRDLEDLEAELKAGLGLL